ncbi:MAG TPA: hypothetical protein VFA26_04595 [Gemmataceae bacterium]|nr:hypothetical protein [Gemmataceae bacterium]
MATAVQNGAGTTDRVRWAARQLGVAAGAGPGPARAALLQGLEGHGFVPPPLRQQAWEVLSGNEPAASFSDPPEEAGLRSDVEAFAARFFALAPAARQERWRELADRCAFSPPLSARLRELGRGLTAEPEAPELAAPHVRELAGHAAALFVLRPQPRAARRQLLLQEMAQDLDAWEGAARQLQKQHPDLAALEPVLIEQLSGAREAQQLLARRREQARKRAEAERRREAERQRARRDAELRQASSRAPSGGIPARWIGGLAIGLVIVGIRVCAGLGSSSYRTTYDPPPRIEFHDGQPMPGGNGRPDLDPELQRILNEMRQRERHGGVNPWDRNDRPPPDPPPGPRVP